MQLYLAIVVTTAWYMLCHLCSYIFACNFMDVTLIDLLKNWLFPHAPTDFVNGLHNILKVHTPASCSRISHGTPESGSVRVVFRKPTTFFF